MLKHSFNQYTCLKPYTIQYQFLLLCTLVSSFADSCIWFKECNFYKKSGGHRKKSWRALFCPRAGFGHPWSKPIWHQPSERKVVLYLSCPLNSFLATSKSTGTVSTTSNEAMLSMPVLFEPTDLQIVSTGNWKRQDLTNVCECLWHTFMLTDRKLKTKINVTDNCLIDFAQVTWIALN